ncbi:type II secretion system F family protein [Gellertiella hungarica]|uniref:Tight adherence protein B n=1 Tax=Gellertiella hungarica TaxID=1572859 RepID=A0A7W6NLE2_9HYPH|nr:type II secretion system F family protein [Gellertiella hungarica]MBB4066455.1 tight adherence protein B [Gellertiella hungarica]
MDINVIAIVLLAAISAAAVSYGILFSRIETEKKTEGRMAKVKSAETDRNKVKAARDRVQDLAKRRKSIQDDLKALEKRQQENNKKNLTVKARIAQAGLKLSPGQFYLISAGVGVGAFVMMLMFGASLFVALGLSFAVAFGLPRWMLGYIIKRRKNKFLDELPNSLDVMVRSIKSGLPLNDALRLIAAEGQEPVKGEFRKVVEAQAVGLSIPEAVSRMYQSFPLQELNFFSIVIAIQSQAGGNLSEALANLSKVLRERRKMKQKIAAVSMEAKASAAIIGSLPFIVALLVYLTSPDYISVLFNDPRGHFIIGFSGIWMSIGIIVMRNMINFDI